MFKAGRGIRLAYCGIRRTSYRWVYPFVRFKASSAMCKFRAFYKLATFAGCHGKDGGPSGMRSFYDGEKGKGKPDE